MTADLVEGAVGRHERLGAFYSDTYSHNTFYTKGWGHIDEDKYQIRNGSYLVQTTVVPVPAAAWLFGSGLVGLISFARRKKE